MSVCAKEMFEAAIKLCEMTDKNGAPLNEGLCSSLLLKTPALCDLCQRDILGYSYMDSAIEIDCSKIPDMESGGFKLYSLPQEVCFVSRIDIPQGDIKAYSSLGYIYVPSDYCGIITVLCRVFPRAIKTENDTFTLDDNSVRSVLPYFLAADFLLEENPERSSFYMRKYEDGKSKLRLFREQASFEPTCDEYGGFAEALI